TASHDRIDEGARPVGDGPGRDEVAVVHLGDHLGVGAGGEVPDHADDAGGAVGEPGEVQAVVPGVELQPGACHPLEALLDVTGRVLHGKDARVLREPGEDVVADADAGAARDVVQHDGQVGGVGDGADVGVHTLLRGPDVVGRDDEQPVRSRRLAIRTACAVSYDPAPAMTIARSPTASTTPRTRASFSGWWVVEDSPVVPLTTRLSQPASTSSTASCCAVATSTVPSGWNGVTIATDTDPKVRGDTAAFMGKKIGRAHV